MKGSPFHAGEQEVQDRCQVREEAEGLGRAMLKPSMSEQHRLFFESLKIAYISTEHPNSSPSKVRVWGSVIAGDNIITCPSSTVVKIKVNAFVPGDVANLKAGQHIGILGLELHLRRRARLNAIITAVTASQLVLEVQQAFGNCPKYIQARRVHIRPVPNPRAQPKRTSSDRGPLDSRALDLVRRSDTFFLATSSGSKEPTIPATALGCDISHRGGPPGFVEAREQPSVRTSGAFHLLRWPDYAGNNMFNSLGNIALNPRAGLLFIDWENGDTLQVTGTVEILYDEIGLPGAERTLELTVHAFVYTEGAVPLAQPADLLEPSPYNPQLVVKQPDFYAARCLSLHRESPTVQTLTFALSPELRATLRERPLEAGQYAVFAFTLPDGRTASRTWTVSADPGDVLRKDAFTVTIKRVGALSSYMHDRVKPGMVLQLRGFGGDFCPDYSAIQSTRSGVLLVAGGIGITPLKAMLQGFLERAIPVTLIYSVQVKAEAVFRTEIENILAHYPKGNALYLTTTREGRPEDFVVTAVESPPGSPSAASHRKSPQRSPGRGLQQDSAHSHSPSHSHSRSPSRSHSRTHSYSSDTHRSHHTHSPKQSPTQSPSPPRRRYPAPKVGAFVELAGRVDAQMLHALVPDLRQRHVYLCGPEEFMQAVSNALLKQLRFPYPDRIHTESFSY